jgi:GNAT superfamily N-acetyltransferase
MFIIRDLVQMDASEYLELLPHLTFHQYEHFRPDGLVGLFEDDMLVASGKVWVELKCGDSVAHIEDVVVHPSHRKKGYGKQIVQELLQRGQQAGAYKVVLSAAPHLRSFYEKCGLVESGIAFTSRRS